MRDVITRKKGNFKTYFYKSLIDDRKWFFLRENDLELVVYPHNHNEIRFRDYEKKFIKEIRNFKL